MKNWKEPALAVLCAALPYLSLAGGVLANKYLSSELKAGSNFVSMGVVMAASLLTRGLVGVTVCVAMRAPVFKNRGLNLLAFVLPMAYTVALMAGTLLHIGVRVQVGLFGQSVLPILCVPYLWRCIELVRGFLCKRRAAK